MAILNRETAVPAKALSLLAGFASPSPFLPLKACDLSGPVVCLLRCSLRASEWVDSWITMTGKCNVLLVDDDENDRLLFSSALQDTGLNVELAEVPDGYGAINYLLSAEPAEFPLPDVVFLDLKMPA